jgi:hypothetical protein
MNATATFVRQVDGWRGDARLYRLSEPIVYNEGDDDEGVTSYVIVSAVDFPSLFGQVTETYIFPANEDGTTINFGELDGSFKDGCDHELALEGAGYAIAEAEAIE